MGTVGLKQRKDSNAPKRGHSKEEGEEEEVAEYFLAPAPDYRSSRDAGRRSDDCSVPACSQTPTRHSTNTERGDWKRGKIEAEKEEEEEGTQQWWRAHLQQTTTAADIAADADAEDLIKTRGGSSCCCCSITCNSLVQ